MRRLAGAGAKVAVVDRDASAAARVADDVGGLAIACDVTVPKAMGAAVAEAETWGGRLDVVHLNAGSVGGQSGSPTSTSRPTAGSSGSTSTTWSSA